MGIIGCAETTVEQGQEQRVSNKGVWLLLFTAIFVLSACYPAPYRMDSRYEREVPPESPRAPLVQLYFYPTIDQTNEQQSRDHYECYNWAVGQTGFDPGRSAIPTDQRVRVVPMPPPGHDTAALAIAGAVLGALIGHRGGHDRGIRGAYRRRRIGFGKDGIRPAAGGGLRCAGQGARRPTRCEGPRFPAGDVRLHGGKRIQRALKVNLNRKCAIHIPFFRRQ
jgi:hypothetical protein